MKVLFLTRLYHPHVGGVEKHIFELCKILSKAHQITIVAEQDDVNESLYEKTPTAEIYRIPLTGTGDSDKKWLIWKWLLSHLDLISSSEIIHIHDVFFWYLPFKILFPFKKSFITFHGYEGNEPPALKNIFWHQLAHRLTNGNICIGGFHKKWYKINPTYVSYGAVNIIKSKHLSPNNESAIFIGRLSKDNGIMDYLSASNNLKLPLDVYGDGPEKSDVTAFVKLNGSKAKIYGFVPESANYLPHHKYAFVSRYLGILEALICQLPVIAHYDSLIKKDYLELAPFNKYIDIVNSPEQIVASVRKIRDNYPAARINAGYIWAMSQTWTKLASIYKSLWTQKR